MDICRRNFIKLVFCIPLIGVVKAYSSTLEELKISYLEIYTPLWLFNDKAKGDTRVISITKIDDKNFSIEFSGGRQLKLDGNTSVDTMQTSNRNKPSKNSMLLKRIFAYALQNIYKHIADKRHKEKGWRIKQEFDNLQREESINYITIKSMYSLIAKLNSMNTVSSISWSDSKKYFVIQ